MTRKYNTMVVCFKWPVFFIEKRETVTNHHRHPMNIQIHSVRQLYQTKSRTGSDKRSPVLFEQTDGSQIAVMAMHISSRLMPSARDNKDQR